MKQHSKRSLQLPASFGFAILLLNSLMMYFEFPAQGKEITYALQWNSYNAIAPYSVLITYWYLSMLSMIVCAIGFIFLKNWARHGLILLSIASLVAIPFQGLYVNTAIHEFLYLIGNALILVPLILSFSSPWDTYFTKPPNKLGAD